MEAQPASLPLTSLLEAMSDEVYALPSAADLSAVHLARSRIWIPGMAPLTSGDLLIIANPDDHESAASDALHSENPIAIAFCGTDTPHFPSDSLGSSPHALLHVPDMASISKLIATLAHAGEPERDGNLRKLTALQRSFSQALDHATPIPEILARLHKQTNAVCLVIDAQGRVTESTGTIPLGELFEQVKRTDAESQRINASGWEGRAVRLQTPDESRPSAAGWLIIAARRRDFPDALGDAATHIAATLIESARRMRVAARAQEEAIRAAIFDEALELNSRPDAPELASRLAALGFSVDSPLRVLALAGTHPSLLSRTQQHDLQRLAERMLDSAEIPHLVTTRGATTIFLTHADLDTVLRALRVHRDDLTAHLVGIGRAIHAVRDVADSYADALIAIRTLRSGRHHGSVMSYEEFDFATRLFASVGLEEMAAYSRTFLAPLLDREPMLEALRKYFEFSQNTSATADALGIHHNTLRYRLSKVEELLDVHLNDPAAVASLFLATTSLDLMDMGAAKHLTATHTREEDDVQMVRAGIPAPRPVRTPSASIARARPPQPPAY